MRIMATNYIGIYSIGGDDGRIGRKYAILSAIHNHLTINKLPQCGGI